MSRQSKLNYMKSLRQILGLTQGEFSCAFGFCAISHYETGRLEWDDETVNEATKFAKDWLYEQYTTKLSAMDELKIADVQTILTP